MNIKFIAIPAIALAAGLSLAACGIGSKAPAPAVTHAVTAAPALTTPAPTTAAPAPVVVVPAPAKTVYVAPAAPAAPVNTGGNCGNGVTAGANTSCAFALNVAADWGPATGAGENPFSVYSPVTGLSYDMTCTGPGTYEYTVSCSGGNNAFVSFTVPR